MKKTKLILPIIAVLLAIASVFAGTLSSDNLALTAFRNSDCEECGNSQTIDNACTASSGTECTCIVNMVSQQAYRQPTMGDCVLAFRNP